MRVPVEREDRHHAFALTLALEPWVTVRRVTLLFTRVGLDHQGATRRVAVIAAPPMGAFPLARAVGMAAVAAGLLESVERHGVGPRRQLPGGRHDTGR